MVTAQPKHDAAEVIAAEEQRIRAFVDFDRHRDASVGEINGMRRALAILGAAGLLATAPCCPPSPEEVVNGWLVETHTHCTCGGGPPFGHEPGCGTTPLVRLSEVKGMAEHDAQVAAKALRDAADDLRGIRHSDGASFVEDTLNAWADRIAGGAT